MIVDLRIYQCKPGKTAVFLDIYERLGWPLQQKYLGKCLGWYQSVEGMQHRVVHLWQFASQADREAKRKEMAADPEWQVYLKAVADAEVLVEMTNTIVVPTKFAPKSA